MSEHKRTPGPWYVVRDTPPYLGDAETGCVIDGADDNGLRAKPEDLALAAAAPDLLAVLRWLRAQGIWGDVQQVDVPEHLARAWDRIRALVEGAC